MEMEDKLEHKHGAQGGTQESNLRHLSQPARHNSSIASCASYILSVLCMEETKPRVQVQAMALARPDGLGRLAAPKGQNTASSGRPRLKTA